jgi:hypothetical protein
MRPTTSKHQHFARLIALSAIFLAPSLLKAEAFSYFTPPKEWEIASPENKQSHVRIGFLGKGKKDFRPTLNLAVEKVGEISLVDYLKAVKEIHTRNPQNRWRQLGKIRTYSGEATLTEIDTKTESGELRMMQMVFLHENNAYIVTAAALKEEFANYYREFQTAFESFTLTQDLFAMIPGEERQKLLKKEFSELKNNKENLSAFEKRVVKDYGDMGGLWQLLLFEEALK